MKNTSYLSRFRRDAVVIGALSLAASTINSLVISGVGLSALLAMVYILSKRRQESSRAWLNGAVMALFCGEMAGTVLGAALGVHNPLAFLLGAAGLGLFAKTIEWTSSHMNEAMSSGARHSPQLA